MSQGYSGKKTVQKFEELNVYQQALELANSVYGVTRLPAFSRDAGLVDQIRRAAVSVVSNIAEGYERGTTTEFVQFLYFAKGSCGEVRAQLQIALGQKYLSKPDCEKLQGQCRLVSGMLHNSIEYLQSSRMPGQKQHTVQQQAVKASEERRRILDELAEQRRRERETQ
ncbi:MAG TPA: four helix bundle protein [bacterium]|nr:four helix bundle protein [bacterium]